MLPSRMTAAVAIFVAAAALATSSGTILAQSPAPAASATMPPLAPGPAATDTPAIPVPVASHLPWDKLKPIALFSAIRARFRAHRPPPAYEVYTISRKELTDQGQIDYSDTYKDRVWVRNSDRAALKRQIYRGINRGYLEFDRPAFNEARDPGPPTADVFEPAPVKPHPVEFVPTPEAVVSEPPTIGVVVVSGLFDYRVVTVALEGNLVHLSVLPTRDPDRNRLREIWADKDTFELTKLVATDKLFLSGASNDVYSVLFTITMGVQSGYPVVTDIHGVVGDGYSGDGQVVDYTYRDISFPQTLPDWYFDKKTYPQHDALKDAPI